MSHMEIHECKMAGCPSEGLIQKLRDDIALRTEQVLKLTERVGEMQAALAAAEKAEAERDALAAWVEEARRKLEPYGAHEEDCGTSITGHGHNCSCPTKYVEGVLSMEPTTALHRRDARIKSEGRTWGLNWAINTARGLECADCTRIGEPVECERCIGLQDFVGEANQCKRQDEEIERGKSPLCCAGWPWCDCRKRLRAEAEARGGEG